MTKVDDLETYILDGKEYLSTYSIRKLHTKVEHLGFTKYACEEVLKRFRIQTDTQTDQTPKQKIIKKGHDQSSARIVSSQYIDDPDELLMSVAIRELNREHPDPRWASILINCKKEKITIKGDDIESFRKLPNEVLANLLSKSKQKIQ